MRLRGEGTIFTRHVAAVPTARQLRIKPRGRATATVWLPILAIKSESNNKLDKCLRRAYSKVDDQVHARAVCFGSGKAMAEGVPHLE